jgi:hypothetical protein
MRTPDPLFRPLLHVRVAMLSKAPKALPPKTHTHTHTHTHFFFFFGNASFRFVVVTL